MITNFVRWDCLVVELIEANPIDHAINLFAAKENLW